MQINIDEKLAPYAPKEELGVWKAKRWTFREKQDAVMRASKILDAEKGLAEMQVTDYQLEQIITCVTPPDAFVEAKKIEGEAFRLTHELIENLDPDVGDAVLEHLEL